MAIFFPKFRDLNDLTNKKVGEKNKKVGEKNKKVGEKNKYLTHMFVSSIITNI